jgi:ketosteroid isomerase-like protein
MNSAAGGATMVDPLHDAWNKDAAKGFADRWLPAWTGNDPELLISFYTEDVIYLDPVVPQGLQGRVAVLRYFRALLAKNPSWVWTQREAVPMENGFVNLWHARFPLADGEVEIEGVCLVFLRGDRIYRNEVYFDRTKLLATMKAH